MDKLEIDEDEQIWVKANQVFPGDLIYAAVNLYWENPYVFEFPLYIDRVSLNGTFATLYCGTFHGEDEYGDDYISRRHNTFYSANYVGKSPVYLLVDR